MTIAKIDVDERLNWLILRSLPTVANYLQQLCVQILSLDRHEFRPWPPKQTRPPTHYKKLWIDLYATQIFPALPIQNPRKHEASVAFKGLCRPAAIGEAAVLILCHVFKPCNSIKDRTSVDDNYGCPMLKSVAVTWLNSLRPSDGYMRQ